MPRSQSASDIHQVWPRCIFSVAWLLRTVSAGRERSVYWPAIRRPGLRSARNCTSSSPLSISREADCTLPRVMPKV